MRHISTIEPLQCTIVFSEDYKCLGEVDILVITPLLPRIQGHIATI
jgi:malate/lactate dehydrogenase